MAKYIIQIPANYRARVGGNSQVSIEASSPRDARKQVIQTGIPAAVLGPAVEIKGKVVLGSLPPDVSEYTLPTSGPDRSSVLRSDRVIGANNPTRPRGMENIEFGLPGGEQVSGNLFAPNINPLPTMAQVQAATPFTPGTPDSPFYQPPGYQRMTTADFAQIRANANRPLFDEQSFLGGSFNVGGSLPGEITGISSRPTTGVGLSYDPTGGSFATDADEIASLAAAARKELADRRARELETAIAATSTSTPEDIDAIEAEMFAQAEQNRLDKIRREAAAAAMATDENDLDASEIEAFAQAERDRLARLRPFADDDDDDDSDNGQPSIPANLPPFWRERYDEYLALSPELQNIILELQIKDFVELEPYRTTATEEGGGVSEVVGADVDPDDLAEFLENNPGATVNPDGSISFDPQTFDPSTIDVTGRIPDPLQLEGFAATDLQDILNIFYANPDRYISEIPVFEDVFNEAGQVVRQRQVGTQQVLSPVAQAALQAFSTQRGAESADIASRFGTATPFGAIAGLGGTAEQAVGLAELQARAGVTNPFAALGTGSTIEDIGSILRGGLDVEQQLALEGLRARGGLDVEQQLALAGLQARGGISPEQRLAEQRMALLPQLFQTSPQALGGLQRVLGEQQLQQALTPFFSAGSFQPQAQVADSASFAQAPSGVNVNIAPDLVENVSGRSPFAGGPVTQTISGTTQPVSAVSPGFRPTVGQFQRADLFDRGGLEAEAGLAGQELTPFLQEVTPLGASTRPGGLGAQRTTRFTY